MAFLVIRMRLYMSAENARSVKINHIESPRYRRKCHGILSYDHLNFRYTKLNIYGIQTDRIISDFITIVI
jgi:hypothetical protein